MVSYEHVKSNVEMFQLMFASLEHFISSSERSLRCNVNNLLAFDCKMVYAVEYQIEARNSSEFRCPQTTLLTSTNEEHNLFEI